MTAALALSGNWCRMVRVEHHLDLQVLQSEPSLSIALMLSPKDLFKRIIRRELSASLRDQS